MLFINPNLKKEREKGEKEKKKWHKELSEFSVVSRLKCPLFQFFLVRAGNPITITGHLIVNVVGMYLSLCKSLFFA